MPKGKKGQVDTAEALSNLKLKSAADDGDIEDADSQSMDSEDEESEELAPKSILRRVHGMKKILVSISYYDLLSFSCYD